MSHHQDPAPSIHSSNSHPYSDLACSLLVYWLGTWIIGRVSLIILCFGFGFWLSQIRPTETEPRINNSAYWPITRCMGYWDWLIILPTKPLEGGLVGLFGKVINYRNQICVQIVRGVSRNWGDYRRLRGLCSVCGKSTDSPHIRYQCLGQLNVSRITNHRSNSWC